MLRPSGERATQARARQAVARAACEQCGRARVPAIEPVRALRDWLVSLPQPGSELRLLLSPQPGAADLVATLAGGATAVTVLSGPEGGLTPAEEDAAVAAGFVGVGLGPRVLRAETAPLVVLAWLTVATSG